MVPGFWKCVNVILLSLRVTFFFFWIKKMACLHFHFQRKILMWKWNYFIYLLVGMTMGWDGVESKDGVFVPALLGFVLLYPRPILHDGENFLTPSLPLGPRKSLPHFVKLYILLICLTISTIFLMKLILLIKIYLKLQLNLSHQIKSIFRKKLNSISKSLTR